MARRGPYWAAALLLARTAVAPHPPRTGPLLLGTALLANPASAGLFTAYHVNVVNRTHAYINTTHDAPWWRRRSDIVKPRRRRWWHRRPEPEPEPATWWDWFFAKPKEPPTHLPWWRGGGHDDSILRPPAYWAAREKLLQEQQRPWWRRRLQAEAAKRARYPDGVAPWEMVPVAFETFGRLGDATFKHLKLLARAEAALVDSESVSTVLQRWCQRLSVALHRANARAVRSAVGLRDARCAWAEA